MTIPKPEADLWHFQSVVDEIRYYLRERCPEWSDHNVSDPGITLMETYAYLVDHLSYRMNRVPESNLRALLGLFGVQATAATPEEGAVVFSAFTNEMKIRIPRGMQVSTGGTGPRVFSVADPGVIPRLFAAGRQVDYSNEEHCIKFEISCDGEGRFIWSEGTFLFFVGPLAADSLSLQLRDPDGQNVIPSGKLTWYLHSGSAWERITDIAMNKAGEITFKVPKGNIPATKSCVYRGTEELFKDMPLHVLRCDVEKKTLEAMEVRAALATPGMRVMLSNVSELAPHLLAVGRERPDQDPSKRFVVDFPNADGWLSLSAESDDKVLCFTGPVAQAPLVRIRWKAEGGELGPPPSAGEWCCWNGKTWVKIRATYVSTSEPGLQEGDIRLGLEPGQTVPIGFLVNPISSVEHSDTAAFRSVGHVFRWKPPLNRDERRLAKFELHPAPRNPRTEDVAVLTIAESSPAGDIRETRPPGLLKEQGLRVINPEPTRGGSEAPTSEQAQLAGVGPVERAVTIADYERIVRDRVPQIGRALAQPCQAPLDVRVLVAPLTAGVVTDSAPDLTVTPEVLQKAADALEPRLLIGTCVQVKPFSGRKFSLSASVRVLSHCAPPKPDRAVAKALRDYFNPVIGGADGTGRPVGRPVLLGEVYQVLDRLSWVHQAIEVRMTVGGDPMPVEEVAVNAITLPLLDSVTISVI